MDYFFTKINKNLLLLLILLVVVVTSFYYIFYLPPLGGDEYLTVWPFRKIIFSDDLKLIIKDFGNNYFFEDHISPLFTFFASIMPFEFFTPIIHIKILNLISFSFIILFLFLIGSEIFKNKIIVFLFILFFIANKTLIYQHLSYYYSYTIVLLIQLINFFFLLNLIKNFNLINYLFYFSLTLIGTLTYENFFLYFFFESIFLCFIYLDKLEIKKIVKLSLIGLKSIACISIYLILHKIKYGNLILSYSKIEPSNTYEFLNIFRMITQNLVDDILFGIPYFFQNSIIQSFVVLIFISFFLFILIKTIKLKKFNKEKKGLFFSSIFCYIGILYTGRYDSGLWTFFTIITYILFFSLIFELYEISKKKFFLFQHFLLFYL